mmetsp:Transcript_2749/g.3791  ORF Transcript_2749/g.3791 Transcript_2749/m.3791 type:complete len:216 (-) Transcript_2749:266-913(-)
MFSYGTWVVKVTHLYLESNQLLPLPSLSKAIPTSKAVVKPPMKFLGHWKLLSCQDLYRITLAPRRAQKRRDSMESKFMERMAISLTHFFRAQRTIALTNTEDPKRTASESSAKSSKESKRYFPLNKLAFAFPPTEAMVIWAARTTSRPSPTPSARWTSSVWGTCTSWTDWVSAFTERTKCFACMMQEDCSAESSSAMWATRRRRPKESLKEAWRT